MRNLAQRRSRAGIAQMYLIGGAVVAAGLLGYLLYKHYKSTHPDGVNSGGAQAQYGRGFQGGPVSMGMQDPRQMGRGGPYGYARAPEDSTPPAVPRAPEVEEENPYAVGDAGLAELQANERRASTTLSIALGSGDVARAAACQASLQQAQAALNGRKTTLLR